MFVCVCVTVVGCADCFCMCARKCSIAVCWQWINDGYWRGLRTARALLCSACVVVLSMLWFFFSRSSPFSTEEGACSQVCISIYHRVRCRNEYNQRCVHFFCAYSNCVVENVVGNLQFRIAVMTLAGGFFHLRTVRCICWRSGERCRKLIVVWCWQIMGGVLFEI